MIQRMFAVFDMKIGSYAQPFFLPSVPAAKRAFRDAASDPSTMLHKHPADYALFYLGDFDDETGSIVGIQPENLGLASSFLNSEA
nr:MAG: nonstructural protein [Microvirus sp.]